MMFAVRLLILWPKQIAAYFEWAGPLVARIIVGYTFMLAGWGKLQRLDGVTEYFTSLGIPAPHILTPLVSGWEFIGGIFLMAGLLTRINAGGLAVIMIVATISAQASEINSIGGLLGLEEATYFAVFTWLAIVGSGKASLDHLLEKKFQ